MTGKRDEYVPALSHSGLTSFYDVVMRLTMRETAFKRRLIEQARIAPGQRVLDLGCGTGTLLLMVKRACPEAQLFGVDGDAEILRLARAKAARSGVALELHRALAFALPYPVASFHRVLSSLLFHHLSPENKRRALAECHRVLRPGGELHLADWGRPANAAMRAAFGLVERLDGYENTRDHAEGRLPQLIEQAGFSDVRTGARFTTIFGTLELFRAQRPAN